MRGEEEKGGRVGPFLGMSAEAGMSGPDGRTAGRVERGLAT